jgi:DNA-binding CsgD family transcriptional regulator
MSDSDDEGRLRTLLVVVLAATLAGGAIDLIMDAPETWLSFHVIYEVSLLFFAMITSIVLWRGWRGARQSLTATRRMLAERATERDTWRASAESALAGLGRAVDDQLIAWGLTPVEREVAVLLLKGQSHKQIAYSTGRSERTVRQHAVSVYQKSRLNGRAELAAFFLEDLMPPTAQA